MLNVRQILRHFHTSHYLFSDNKALLSKLRKKTGYTFTNCKNALEVCNNDYEEAEAWLKKQALALGWATAYKVAGRRTPQGVIAITADERTAAMVEVNCETDFVAKNSLFQALATNVAKTCFTVAKERIKFENAVSKVYLDPLRLKSLTGTEGRKLEDETALLVSQVGENVTLRRALCLNVQDDLRIIGCTHPASDEQTASLGKYGSILVYKSTSSVDNILEIAKQLCQHVIGMKPDKIGKIDEDKPLENKDNETTMIHQEFLMDPELLVSDVLKENHISLIDFTRFECGEDVDEKESPIEQKEEIKISA